MERPCSRRTRRAAKPARLALFRTTRMVLLRPVRYCPRIAQGKASSEKQAAASRQTDDNSLRRAGPKLSAGDTARWRAFAVAAPADPALNVRPRHFALAPRGRTWPHPVGGALATDGRCTSNTQTDQSAGHRPPPRSSGNTHTSRDLVLASSPSHLPPGTRPRPRPARRPTQGDGLSRLLRGEAREGCRKPRIIPAHLDPARGQ
jgi:hypothetical protein